MFWSVSILLMIFHSDVFKNEYCIKYENLISPIFLTFLTPLCFYTRERKDVEATALKQTPVIQFSSRLHRSLSRVFCTKQISDIEHSLKE